MATTPTLYLNSIEGLTGLLDALEVLVINNTSYLERHPRVPGPYESGVRYHLEKEGHEDWLGVEALLARGLGDCEDLASYLASWYRARKGIFAKVVLKRFSKGGKVWYHAVVKLPNGTIEDPSAKLGMRG